MTEEQRRIERERWARERARLSPMQRVKITSRRAHHEARQRAKGRRVGIRWLLRYSAALSDVMRTVRFA